MKSPLAARSRKNKKVSLFNNNGTSLFSYFPGQNDLLNTVNAVSTERSCCGVLTYVSISTPTASRMRAHSGGVVQDIYPGVTWSSKIAPWSQLATFSAQASAILADGLLGPNMEPRGNSPQWRQTLSGFGDVMVAEVACSVDAIGAVLGAARREHPLDHTASVVATFVVGPFADWAAW